MQKRIWFLISVAFLLLAISFFLESLNKTNLITALIVQDVDFNNIEQLSSVNKENDIITFKLNDINYSLKIENIYNSNVIISIGQERYTINLRGTKNIDLDKDALSDLSLTIDNILPPDISLTIKRISCIPNWYCGYFSNCRNSIETRQCTDLNKCQNPAFRPDLSRPCVESCNDNIINQDETSIDCGGSKCKPCGVSLSYIYFWASIPIILAFVSVFVSLLVVQLKKRRKKGKIIIEDNPDQINIQKLKREEKTIKSVKKPDQKTQLIINEDAAIVRLRKYIEDSLNKNFNEFQIKAKLLTVGWPERVINENIWAVKKKLGKSLL
ncbi:hypothetical protein HYX18_04820 [Candidatus Woesearchaeota archaeon]|nr:hypothetical protein [Candidatus Woesearchaeota archaeon]